MKNSNELKIAYFGGEPIGEPVLRELLKYGVRPSLVVTNPDRKSGRKQELTPPPVKKLAEENGLPVFQPENFKDKDALTPLTDESWDLFVVVAYNHILPEWLIELPKNKTINLHPSLLPKLRGPSPIRTALLEDKPEEVGVSIMLLDNEMDHGPLLSSRPYIFKDGEWPLPGRELDAKLALLGAGQLLTVINEWTSGNLEPETQNHEGATYTKKLTKDMGELFINPRELPRGEAARQTWLKICALDGWPGTFFFHEGKRIKITEVVIENNELKILEVVPEGKSEVGFTEWLKNQAN